MKKSSIVLLVLVSAAIIFTFLGLRDKQDTRRRIFIVDNSLSMGPQTGYPEYDIAQNPKGPGTDEPLRAAKNFIEEQLSQLQPTVDVDIFQLNGPPFKVISGKAGGAQLKLALNAIVIRPPDNKLLPVLREVSAIPNLGSDTEIFLVTDSQGSLWRNEQDEVVSPELEKVFCQLCDKFSVTIANITGSTFQSENNFSIAGFDFEDLLIPPDEPLYTTLNVSNPGRLRLNLELTINGGEDPTKMKPLYSDTIQCKCSEYPLSLPEKYEGLEIPRPGLFFMQASARVESLDANFDNHFYTLLKFRNHLRIICVEHNTAKSETPPVSELVRMALAPKDEDLAESFPEWVEIKSVPELKGVDLDGTDLVILCDTPELSEEGARDFKTWLRQGGRAVFFAGNNFKEENYNRLLGGNGPLCGRFDGAVSSPQNAANRSYISFNYRDFAHPIAAPIRYTGKKVWSLPRIYRHAKFIPQEGKNVRRVIDYNDGSPAVLSIPYGNGRTVLFTTSPAPECSNMPAQPQTAPLLGKLLRSCISDLLDCERSDLLLPVISACDLNLPADAANVMLESWQGDLRLPIPSGQNIRVEKDGFYRLLYSLDGKDFVRPVAVNFPRVESVFSSYGKEPIRTTFSDKAKFKYLEFSETGCHIER